MSKPRRFEDIGFPSTHLIYSIAGRDLSTTAIVGELADNAFGYAAGNAQNFTIRFVSGERAIFADDGDGMVDINKLFEMGGHLHDPRKTERDIGHFGQGAKDALLSLGWDIRVQTVHKGVYHDHSVNWLPIAKAASPYAWPKKYKDRGRPAQAAPAEIKNGGTRIIVTKLKKGKSLPTIDALRVGLVRTFKPALRSGRKIFIDVNGRTALLDTPDIVRIDDRIQASGAVNGMPFSVIAGALLEHSPVHNKVCYGFEHRIICEETKLCAETLPPLFTCEVQLGSAWKPHLQANKLSIAAYKEELQTAVFELVKAVWDSTKTVSDEARIDFINAQLARSTAKIFIFRPKHGDTHDKGPDVETAGRRGGGDTPPGPTPGPRPEPSAKPGSEGGTTPKHPKAHGIKYQRLDDMDKKYAVDVVADRDSLLVRLNGKLSPIQLAYARPFKVNAVWPTISYGITKYLIENPQEFQALLPPYEELLGTNMDDPKELEARLFTFMLEQQPTAEEAKEFEPKAAEI